MKAYTGDDVVLREVGRGVWMAVVGGHVFDAVLVGHDWVIGADEAPVFTARTLLDARRGIVSWLNTVAVT